MIKEISTRARNVATVLVLLAFCGTGQLVRAQQRSGATATDDGARTARRVSRVLVTGNAVVQAQPDTAILQISVVTQSRRALDAQQDNANKTDAVVRALRATAGAGAENKTSGYNLQPQRVYKEKQTRTITV